MPTLFKMNAEKQADAPTVVIAETASSAKPRNTKKYVIIAVSAILSAAIILTAILVGMYIFSEAQKEIIKYRMTFNPNAKQDVESDPNTNVVEYHVTNLGQEAWIVNDFSRDIQVVKIQSESGTNCYVNALNKSTAMDPSKIAKPTSNDLKGSTSLTYVRSNTPVSDISFLTKKARDMCSGISTYWVYPQCQDKSSQIPDTNMTQKSKRQTVDNSPYYYAYYISYGGTTIPCVQGCCKTVCACKVDYTWNVDQYGYIYCRWVISSCSPTVTANPVSAYCSTGPRGLTCPNRSPATWPTC